ncbi:MAG: SDR family oxidoreductase [Balneolaceae bacterium]
MKEVALITGASSGIGKDLAFVHAEKGKDLVIVARRKEQLEELKKELESKHNVAVKVIAKDLIAEGASQEIYDELEKEGIDVEYLINNAGFGGHGRFHEQDSDFQQQMITLNISSLTEMNRLFLPAMIARDSGRILNVASTAGYIPGPLQAVYFATKAYVLSLSQGIAGELMGTKVTSTALCPGAVKTEFMEVANLEGTDLTKGMKSSRSVAEFGYDAMMKGKTDVINEPWLGFQLKYMIQFVPKKMVFKMIRKLQEKTD